MLRANLKKIKSAPKRSWLVAALLLVVMVGGLVGVLVVQDKLSWDGPPPNAQLGDSVYILETAKTEAAQEKGLGGRLAMDTDKGMVFPYAEVAPRCFWMKDMHFALDIIWVDAGKKVTHIERTVSPATYPRTYCYPAQYVIELNAGQAAKSHMQLGQVLDF